ncbi:MAG TPA: beta-propeller fold lactonase family protein [Albitalea sp.]|uniref:beta-propeller fold lactonase family protein n=1 Tax=Piscinibacter sp. TaxID=1903157 RepID=UPI002ED01C9D
MDPFIPSRRRARAAFAAAFAACLTLSACGGGGGYGDNPPPPPPAPPPAPAVTAPGPQSSGPIQISPDDKTVWVANPETNTVAALNVASGAHQLIAEIAVGKEPRNLAVSPDGKRVVVANAGDDTLTVLDASAAPYARITTVKVGTEPYGLAFTPNGRRLYVANARSNTVSVVDAASYQVLRTITGVGQEPRGVAITNNGDANDDDEKVYVTQFFGVDRAGVLIGADDYKEGHVAVISAGTDTVIKQAVLNPLADTGFKSNGSALKKLAPKTDAAGKPVFDVVTGAFPNMMQSVAIKGDRAYLPNTCASPDGPVRFNVNVQSCLSVLDTTTDAEGTAGGAAQTLNMNRGINFEVGDPADERKRLFLAVPWAVAFKAHAAEGYAVSMSSNVVVKVVLDADGTPSINAPKAATDPGAIVRILVGQGPRGIVIDSTDTRAYVANENSRNVSVIDLATEQVIATVATASLPQAGTDEAKRLIGKAVFDSSTGVDLPGLSSADLSGVVQRFPARLSSEGWSSCHACHGFGRTDNVAWVFGSGLRRTSSLHATFNPKDANDIKLLNHSAINNEVQDFQNNILDVSGGLGLIVDAAGNTAGGANGAGPGGSKPPLDVKNAGRSAQLDALAFYVATGIGTPRSPLAAEPAGTALGLKIGRGRQLFADANCASCHGGPGWASGRFNRLPAQPTISLDQGVPVTFDVLRDVGTFIATDLNEIKQNGTPGAGALGFNPPSLLGTFALAPYLHNGSAPTLLDVMTLRKHRTSGLPVGAIDPFDDAGKLADIVQFLQTIDTSTAPFDITPGP